MTFGIDCADRAAKQIQIASTRGHRNGDSAGAQAAKAGCRRGQGSELDCRNRTCQPAEHNWLLRPLPSPPAVALRTQQRSAANERQRETHSQRRGNTAKGSKKSCCTLTPECSAAFHRLHTVSRPGTWRAERSTRCTTRTPGCLSMLRLEWLGRKVRRAGGNGGRCEMAAEEGATGKEGARQPGGNGRMSRVAQCDAIEKG